MTTLHSYELNGKKQSFADWVSNITPEDTPFVSLTKKKKATQTMYQWESTNLKPPSEQKRVLEGSPAVEDNALPIFTATNYTQIFRKVVSVSDTADAVETFGRTKESKYQLEKAAKELKRDIEYAFLWNAQGFPETSGYARRTSGFMALCPGLNLLSREVGVPTTFYGVHSDVNGEKLGKPALPDFFKMFRCLFMTGSKADTIMFHPKHAEFFAGLQEAEMVRSRWFENTDKVVIETTKMQDQFGKWWNLVPNRNMPDFSIFFFRPSDWTQRVLRAPRLIKLSKQGSSTKWMIEAEIGLENKAPFSSGLLHLRRKALPQSGTDVWTSAKVNFTKPDGSAGELSIAEPALVTPVKEGTSVTFTLRPLAAIPVPTGGTHKMVAGDFITIYRNGSYVSDHEVTAAEARTGTVVLKLTDKFRTMDSATYLIALYQKDVTYGIAYTGTVPLIAEHE